MASSFKKLIMMANQIDYEPSLPKEYVQLEYLESAGKQYIDTGFTPKDEAWVEIDAQKKSGIDAFLLYLPNNTESTTIRFNLNVYSKNTVYFRYGNSNTSHFVANTNTIRHTYRIDSKSCYIDGVNVWNHGNTMSLNAFTKSVALFAKVNADGSVLYPFVGKIFSAKFGIGKSESLNLIPALRIADSKPGMYDLVTGQFFTNQGTGEFVYSAYISAQIYINTILQSVVTGEELDNMDSLLYQISQSQEDMSSINTQLENIINT